MKKTILFIGLISSAIVFSQNTQLRNDAGLATTMSGFYETNAPINYPDGATAWWHLLDVRHSNSSNNYGMQFAGSFFNQDLYFRKTNDNGSQPWMRAILENSAGNVKIGKNDNTNSDATLRVFKTDGVLVEIADSKGKFQIIKSKCNGCGASGTIPGDAVMRSMGLSHNIVFSIPNDVNDGGSYIGFEDSHNGIWAKFFNNSTAKFNGKIFAKEVEVKANVWADYVFNKDYRLLSLEEVENYISKNGHLPNIPSASEVLEKGINVAEMDARLLEKIEELTLYSIQQNNHIKELKKENEILKNQFLEVENLKKQIQKLLNNL